MFRITIKKIVAVIKTATKLTNILSWEFSKNATNAVETGLYKINARTRLPIIVTRVNISFMNPFRYPRIAKTKIIITTIISTIFIAKFSKIFGMQKICVIIYYKYRNVILIYEQFL